MDTLLSRVEAAIVKHRMVRPKERLLVACSGGPDSVALFHLLKELAPRLGVSLHLIHFDHGLRRGSAKDLEFVRKMARRFHVPFYAERRKAKHPVRRRGLSPEESARRARYDFFEQAAKKTLVRKVVLAHHRDDQAETVLMRILQGTGLRGLQGIRPVARIGCLTVLRPLLEIGRDELRRFLAHRRILFRVDPTNRSGKFLRNRIRSRLLPFLEREFNPRVREGLLRLAETASAESQGLDEWVRRHWKSCLRARRNGTVWLKRDFFLSLPGVLQFRLLDQVLRSLDERSGLDFESWRRIEKRLNGPRLRVTLPRNLDFALTPKRLVVRKSSLPKLGLRRGSEK